MSRSPLSALRAPLSAIVLMALLTPLSVAAQDSSARALMQLARQQSTNGQPAAALETLRKARALAPNSEEVLSAYARTALAARTPMPAITTLAALTRMCPTVADYHYLLGVAFLQAGDAVSAGDRLRAAEALEPDRALTLVALGLAFNTRKMFGDAKPALQRSLELEPESIEAAAALAEAEEGLDELDAAEARARRVLAAAAGNPTAHLVLGMVLMKRGQHAAARDQLLAAAHADATLQKAHYQLSLVYARLGDEASSRKHLELYQQSQREAQARLKEIRAR
jgi:cellulose synthase operon protein C